MQETRSTSLLRGEYGTAFTPVQGVDLRKQGSPELNGLISDLLALFPTGLLPALLVRFSYLLALQTSHANRLLGRAGHQIVRS